MAVRELTWNEKHCYGCGQPWSERAVELFAVIAANEDVVWNDEAVVEELNAETAAHAGCFE